MNENDDEVLGAARAVWRASRDRDEAFASEARVARLARARSVPSPARRFLPVAALALGVALVGLRAWRDHDARRAPSAAATAVAPAELVSAAPIVAKPAPAPLVVARACPECSRPLARGDRLVVGEELRVPAGAKLALSFAVDADVAQEIAGPAELTIQAAGPVRAEPSAAEVRPDADPQAEWGAAQAALRARDRSSAERHLRALLGVAGAPQRLREASSFALAELELARGLTGPATARLDPLTTARDPSLAADAVFLRSRATSSPRERAELYARYLATKPPSPYREQAMVEQADARLRAGDAAGARSIVAALHAHRPVPDVVRPGLARLEEALRAP